MNMASKFFSQNEILTCSLFNLKMFLFTITLIICISCVSSCFLPYNTSTKDTQNTQDIQDTQENFGNNEFFSYKDTINPGYFTSQYTVLTSSVDSLIVGEANMYVTNDILLKVPVYILDVDCDLYIINGNPFGQKLANVLDYKNSVQKYMVHLNRTKTGENIHLGQLLKDNDGVYKLRFKSTELEKYATFNEVQIIYEIDGKDSILLSGKFSL